MPKESPLMASDFASAYSPSPKNARVGHSKMSLIGSRQSIGGDSMSKKENKDFMDYRKDLNECIDNFNVGIDRKLAANDADFMAAYRVSLFFFKIHLTILL